MVLFNVCRGRNTDRIFVAFPTQSVMLQKLTELSLSIHICSSVSGFWSSCLCVGGVVVLHLDNLPRALLQCKRWWPLGSQNTYMSFVYMIFFSLLFLLTPPPPPAPPLPPVAPHARPPPPPPPPLSPQLMQSCDLCYLAAQTSGFVGLGINAFPGLCVHYFCVPCCVCWYEHSLKSNKPFES